MTTLTPNSGHVKLRKPVEALVMVPRTNKLSPLGRKMYNVLLYVSQMTLRNMQSIPPATFLFEAPLVDILKICGAENQNCRAKQYLAEMRRSEVVWSSPDSYAELQEVGFSLLSETRIIKTRGSQTMVHWALPPSLYETLADPDRWASIDLMVLARLETYAAIVLYEICSKYRDNPTHVTCRKDPNWWIELLSASPAPLDPATGQRKLPEWRKFKHTFVNSAVDQINELSDLSIELLEDRHGGKAIKTLQFKITVKKARAIAMEVGEAQADPKLVQYATRLGVTSDHELAYWTKTQGQEAVLDGLRLLEERQKQMSLPLVRSPTSYMRTIMTEQKADAVGSDGPSASSSAKVVLSQGGQGRTSTELPLEQVWLENRWVEIFQEIMSLPLVEQQHWVKAYADSLKAKGMMTPSVQRRVERADWYVGMVKAGVIDFYAVAKHGVGWNVPPVLAHA